jgi:cation:H+ antiporter
VTATLSLLYLFGGVAYLLMAGDLLVRGALALARRLRVSPVVVGLTVVALGTSAPELVVSVSAALGGLPELAITNVTGSNIANILLVVGVPAIIYPMACDQEGVARDALFMLGASFLFAGLAFLGPLGRGSGAVLLLGLVVFFAFVLRPSAGGVVWSPESGEAKRVLGIPSSGRMIALFLGLGAVGLSLGADLLIRGAVGLASAVGISTAVAGLTVVALGTSLPELATTLVAAFKREADLAVGNIVGSNVLNLFAIMGITALVTREAIRIPDGLVERDLPVMLGAALLLAVVALARGKVGRALGVALFAGYMAYIFVLFRSGG